MKKSLNDMKFDKNKDLIEYLDWILMDESNNQAIVTRDWSGELVEDGIKGGVMTYKFINIEYGDPYIQPLLDNFNKEDNLYLLAKAKETG